MRISLKIYWNSVVISLQSCYKYLSRRFVRAPNKHTINNKATHEHMYQSKLFISWRHSHNVALERKGAKGNVGFPACPLYVTHMRRGCDVRDRKSRKWTLENKRASLVCRIFSSGQFPDSQRQINFHQWRGLIRRRHKILYLYVRTNGFNCWRMSKWLVRSLKETVELFVSRFYGARTSRFTKNLRHFRFVDGPLYKYVRADEAALFAGARTCLCWNCGLSLLLAISVCTCCVAASYRYWFNTDSTEGLIFKPKEAFAF